MIIRNNAANRRLVNQLRDIVDAETGFRSHIDRTWNCGKDIRFEIGVVGMDAPFITVTDLDADGSFQISLRMQLTEVPIWKPGKFPLAMRMYPMNLSRSCPVWTSLGCCC